MLRELPHGVRFRMVVSRSVAILHKRTFTKFAFSLTSFSFTVQSDVFENVPFTAEMVDGELMAVYESHLGVGFWARSVYDANVQLESWTTTAHDNGTTLRVATPLSSLGGGSAVPEPTAALLLAFGAFGLAVARRRS